MLCAILPCAHEAHVAHAIDLHTGLPVHGQVTGCHALRTSHLHELRVDHDVDCTCAFAVGSPAIAPPLRTAQATTFDQPIELARPRHPELPIAAVLIVAPKTSPPQV